jgi:hypothetical protein
MVKKKLLTLAGLAGILACGACFLPPLPRERSPLPTVLASVHKIAIKVEDGTAGNLFDPQIMSNATAANFNRLWEQYPVRAEAFNPGGRGDAVLKIIVHHKVTSCNSESNGKQFCSIELIATYTLTTVNGGAFEMSPQKSAKFGFQLLGDSLPENLNANPFRQEASSSLAMTAGHLFLVHSY